MTTRWPPELLSLLYASISNLQESSCLSRIPPSNLIRANSLGSPDSDASYRLDENGQPQPFEMRKS